MNVKQLNSLNDRGYVVISMGVTFNILNQFLYERIFTVHGTDS